MKSAKILYHVTTPATSVLYESAGCIKSPGGFTTLLAAMACACKVRSTVIYEVECPNAHKLPNNHNKYGEAWWNDGDVTEFRRVFSADHDA